MLFHFCKNFDSFQEARRQGMNVGCFVCLKVLQVVIFINIPYNATLI